MADHLSNNLGALMRTNPSAAKAVSSAHAEGITAVASIFRRARGSTRRRTSTAVIAGKWRPITSR